MNKTIGIQLAIYGLVLVGLSYLTDRLAPTIARPTLITGLVGAGLCLACTALALLGKRGKALPILTLIGIAYVLLGQAVMTWSGKDGAAKGYWPAASVITLLFLLTMGMLVRIAHAGAVFGGQPPNSRAEAPPKAQTSMKAAAPTDVSKRS